MLQLSQFMFSCERPSCDAPYSLSFPYSLYPGRRIKNPPRPACWPRGWGPRREVVPRYVEWGNRRGRGGWVREIGAKGWSVSFLECLESSRFLCCVKIKKKAVFLNDGVPSNVVDKDTTQHLWCQKPEQSPANGENNQRYVTYGLISSARLP